MVIDAHVHYGPWQRDGSDADLFTVEAMLTEARASGIDRVVQVTASRDRWDVGPSIEGFVRNPGFVAGVIGRFDPAAPNVEERLREFKALPGILGIRVSSRTPGGANWLGDRALDPFLAAAQRFDVAVQPFCPYEATALKATAHRFPGVRFLIDHMGLRYYPERDNRDVFREWPELMRLAEEPNVWIKCSYFPEATRDLEGFPFPIAREHFRRLYEHAGPKKLVWGSNFPPSRERCSLRESVDFVRVHCDFFSPWELARVLGGNFLEYFAPNSRRAGA